MKGNSAFSIPNSALLGLGGFFLHSGLLLAEANGFADPIAEIVELGPAGHAAALDFDLGDFGRVQRKLALDAFAGNNATHREHLAAAAAGTGDHRTAEDLNALIFAFKNSRMHIDRIADCEF